MTDFLPQTGVYALRAMTCIASLPPGERASNERIASSTLVPKAFLSKVLRRLVTAGLLDGLKGHGGGFALARPKEEIRFVDVLEAVGVQLSFEHCAFGFGRCSATRPCPLHDHWVVLRGNLHDWAASRTFADVHCHDVRTWTPGDPSLSG